MTLSRIAKAAAIGLLGAVAALGLWPVVAAAQEAPVVIPPPALDLPASDARQGRA